LYLNPPLEQDTIKVLGEFLVLWSLYEAKFFDTRYSNTSLKEKIDSGIICLNDLEMPLSYLKIRYLSNSRTTNETFEKLQLRGNDYPGEVRQALEGGGTPHEVTFAILVIVYRLRNNLFHGIKQTAMFNMQKENFQMASAILTDILWSREFFY
jgi:hypothetical protein